MHIHADSKAKVALDVTTLRASPVVVRSVSEICNDTCALSRVSWQPETNKQSGGPCTPEHGWDEWKASTDCRGLMPCQVSGHSDQPFSLILLTCKWPPSLTHTSIQSDRISAPPYYVVGADNKVSYRKQIIARQRACLTGPSRASCLSRSLKVIGTDTDRSATYVYEFLFMVFINDGLSRTVTEITGDNGRKSQKSVCLSVCSAVPDSKSIMECRSRLKIDRKEARETVTRDPV